MKTIKFQTKNILPQLTQVVAVVNSKNTMPILSCVKLDTYAKGSGISLKMTASDSETWIMQNVEVEGDAGISICIDASDFLKGLRNLDDDYVEMKIDEEKNAITCKYTNGYFAISCLDSKEFPLVSPDIENMQKYNIDASKLLFLISNVGFAMNNDELRPVFNSVHFDFFRDRMVTVATDGQRLAKLTDWEIDGKENDYSFNLPSKPSSLILGVLASCQGDVSCIFNDNMIVIENSNFSFITRLIEGKYPNYDSVIPKTYNYLAKVNKKSLMASIKRVSAMGDNVSELVKFYFNNNEIVVSAENVEFFKSAKESIACDYTGSPLVIGFKSSYFIQSLQNIESENIKIELIADDRPCILEPDKETNIESKFLLMPLAIH